MTTQNDIGRLMDRLEPLLPPRLYRKVSFVWVEHGRVGVWFAEDNEFLTDDSRAEFPSEATLARIALEAP